MSARLPTHLEISGMIRAVEELGGFAMVLAKGDPDSGSILVTISIRGGNARLYERMPALDGDRIWTEIMAQNSENIREFDDYLRRRQEQDRDLWVLELDIADAKRFAAVQQILG